MVENENNFSFIQLLKYLRTKALLILSISVGVSILAFGLSLTVNDYYTSSARLTIAEQQTPPSGSSTANMLGSFGGGLSLASSPLHDKVLEVRELMSSRDFLRHLLSKQGIYDRVVYAKSYDVNTNQIIFDKEYSQNATDDMQSKLIPIDEKFFVGLNEFKDNFGFSFELKSNYYTISYSHVSPEFSKQILDLIIQELNLLQRENNIREANSALKYLENELLNATNAEVKGSISKLIEIQLKNKMIANITPDYLVKVIDSPYKLVSKTGPNRGVIFIIAFFISLFILLPIFTFLFSKNQKV